jgi:chromosome segregation ATPase
MARSGLYKSDVKKARDALLAQGKHPSVDAVRVALGNTGSKTTIHKYLKELDEEEGAGARKASISEALQDLVERLAAQLQEEANTQIETLRTEHAAQARQYAENLAIAHQDIQQLHDQLQRAHASYDQEQAAHANTQTAFQQETIARHTLEQQVADLKDRLRENEAHRLSLEEKHRHAREALDHYRQSVKDQRDQDQRRHEQQVQQLQAELRQAQQTIVIKQEEVTRLNQEGARLITELSHTRQALHTEQGNSQKLVHKIELLQAVESRCSVLEAQLTEREARIVELQQRVSVATATAEASATQIQELQLEIATAKATLQGQQDLIVELRANAGAKPAPVVKT